MNAASVAGRRIAADAGQHVDGERQHLERQEDDQQIGGRRHQHHAGQREQHQRVVLARAAAARARRSAPDSASDSTPTTIEHQRDEQAEVVGRRRRRSWCALRFHSSTRRDGGADEADHRRAAPIGIRSPGARNASAIIAAMPPRSTHSHRHDGAEWTTACQVVLGTPESARGPESGDRGACALNRAATCGAPARAAARPTAPSAAGTGSAARPSAIVIATIGTSDHPLARRQIRQRGVLLVRDRAVVHALEHPQHVDRRQDHAGRGERRQPRIPAERAEQDQELADEAVQAGQADRRQRDDQERRRPAAASPSSARRTRRSAACAGGRTACRR